MTNTTTPFTWESLILAAFRVLQIGSLPLPREVFVVESMLQAAEGTTGLPLSVQRLVRRFDVPLHHPAFFTRTKDGLYALTPGADVTLQDAVASKVLLAAMHLGQPETRKAILAKAGLLCGREGRMPNEFQAVLDEVMEGLEASLYFTAADRPGRHWQLTPAGRRRL